MKLRNLTFVLVASFALVQVASAQDHWVATWAAAPQQARGGPPTANPAPAVFNDQTVRMVVHTSIGGRRARVTLSNTFGNIPLKIGAAHIALRGKESAIAAGSDRTLMKQRASGRLSLGLTWLATAGMTLAGLALIVFGWVLPRLH